MTPSKPRLPPKRAPSTAGAAARAERLLSGLVVRATRGDAIVAQGEFPRVELLAGARVVVRITTQGATLVVDVDPRAGGGDPAALRRLGSPHPDRARSADGWRQAFVRNQADAARVVDALRGTGGPVRNRTYSFGGMVIERVRVRYIRDPGGPDDGKRVLVDDAWPRDVPREAVHVDVWMPDVAPSRAMRQAFGAVPGAHRGFRRAYLSELRGGVQADAVSKLRAMLREGPLTLLTGVRDLPWSPAAVLAHAVTHGRTPKR